MSNNRTFCAAFRNFALQEGCDILFECAHTVNRIVCNLQKRSAINRDSLAKSVANITETFRRIVPNHDTMNPHLIRIRGKLLHINPLNFRRSNTQIVADLQDIGTDARDVVERDLKRFFIESNMSYWSTVIANRFGEGPVSRRKVLEFLGPDTQFRTELKKTHEELVQFRANADREKRESDSWKQRALTELQDRTESLQRIADRCTHFEEHSNRLEADNARLQTELTTQRELTARLQQNIAQFESQVAAKNSLQTGFYEVESSFNPTSLTQALDDIQTDIHQWALKHVTLGTRQWAIAERCWACLGVPASDVGMKKPGKGNFIKAFESFVYTVLLHRLRIPMSSFTNLIDLDEFYSTINASPSVETAEKEVVGKHLAGVESFLWKRVAENVDGGSLDGSTAMEIFRRSMLVAEELDPEGFGMELFGHGDAAEGGGMEGGGEAELFWVGVSKVFLKVFCLCKAMGIRMFLPVPRNVVEASGWKELLYEFGVTPVPENQIYGSVLDCNGSQNGREDVEMGRGEDGGEQRVEAGGWDEGGEGGCLAYDEKHMERPAACNEKGNVRFAYTPGLMNDRMVLKRCMVWCD
ncbi:hypothetical protein HK097_010868 [Rhizophlyctis rosea]|uniref:Uncharacterized protein n=1 Tax=Rhizophlyctis rosea TaxID=64517 RepID=A0AAD5S9E3_9FUNG|nr:hypothetical protein HK097_010868 [Rhizophlyctis rosea]